jgi:hypothetical protein
MDHSQMGHTLIDGRLRLNVLGSGQQTAILDVSQPYGPSRLVPGIALPLPYGGGNS